MGLRSVIAENSVSQDLRLEFGEVAYPEKRHWVCGRFRKDRQKQDTDQYSERPLNLAGSAIGTLTVRRTRGVAHKKEPLPASQPGNASHVKSILISTRFTKRDYEEEIQRWGETHMPYAKMPVKAAASRLPLKNHEKRLLVSSRVYHRVMV